MPVSEGAGFADAAIDELRISYGDHQRRTIALYRNRITCKNSILPGDREKGYANNYFDEREIPVSREEWERISGELLSAGLLPLLRRASDQTIWDGANEQSLYCLFEDGRQVLFRTGKTAPAAYKDIVKILEAICGLQNTQRSSDLEESDERKRIVLTPCCGVAVPERWSFCPKCGKETGRMERKESSEEYDPDETSWPCASCGESVPMRYRYCGRCGRKRSW